MSKRCGNNPKWCESCVSKGKCASTSPSEVGRELGEKFGENFKKGLEYGTKPEGKVGKKHKSKPRKENEK